MNNSKRKQAFSLAETIVFVIITAIIIAATTPLLTRKIVNIQDAGSTIGGGQHGRIELYTKEIVCFGSDCHEKTINNPLTGEIFTVYERKDDEFYKAKLNEEPVVDDNGNKSTIYEEIKGAKPHKKDKDGNVLEAKATIDGKEVILKKSTKYIFEDNNVTYKKGTLQTTNGVTTFIPKKPEEKLAKDNRDNDTNRIIEGHLTTKLPDKNKGNNLWHVEAKTTAMQGTVTPIPWKNVYSGTGNDAKLVEDQSGPIKTTDSKGNPQVNVKIPQNAANVTIHAVGGGGAGGAASADALNAFVMPSTSTPAKDLESLQKDLAKRVRKIAKDNGISYDAWSDSQIVPIINKDKFDLGTGKEPNGKLNLFENQKQTIDGKDYLPPLVINKADGTISGITDVSIGLIFPHQILDYTEILGSQTQDSITWDMPQWFTWNTFTHPVSDDDKPVSKFQASLSKCSTDGGAGGKIVFHTYADDGGSCLHKKYVDPYEAVGKCQTGTDTVTETERKKVNSCLEGYTSVNESSCSSIEDEKNKITTTCSDRSSYAILSCADYPNMICRDCQKTKKVTGCISQKCANGKIKSDLYQKNSCENLNRHEFLDNSKNLKKEYNTTAKAKDKYDSLTCYDLACVHRDTTKDYPVTFLGGQGGKGTCGYVAVDIVGNVYSDNSKFGGTGQPGTASEDNEVKEWGNIAYESMDGQDGTGYNISIISGSNKDSGEVKPGKGGKACRQAQSLIANNGNLVCQTTDCATYYMVMAGYTSEEMKKIIEKMQDYNAKHEEQAIVFVIDGEEQYDSASDTLKRTQAFRFEVVNVEPDGGLKWKDAEGAVPDKDGIVSQVLDQDETSLPDEFVNFNNSLDSKDPIEVTNQGYNGLYVDEIVNWAGLYDGKNSERYKDITEQEYKGGMPLSNSKNGDGDWKVTPTNSKNTGRFALAPGHEDFSYFCRAVNGSPEGTYKCADTDSIKHDGDNGTANKGCTKGKQTVAGASCGGAGIYNTLYIWTIPYASNYLGYGEGGGVGEYKSTKVTNVVGDLVITLGKGGTWNGKWDKETNMPNAIKGADGTATIVKNLGRTLVNAKGGKGGNGSLRTNRYDYCFARNTIKFPNTPVCYKNGDTNKSINCCLNGKSTKTVADIITTAIKTSEFDKQKTTTGNSAIVGLGLGRGAQGAGTKSKEEDQVYGIRRGVNASTYKSYDNDKDFYKNKRVIYRETSSPNKKPEHVNIMSKPSDLNFKGGDGAVIITW